MAHPLMPKAKAVWLVDNTVLTFEQVAEFTGLHELEVQAIADEEVAIGMQGMDPIAAGELSKEEIARCEADSSQMLVMMKAGFPDSRTKQKGARYTPVSKRQDRPNAIAWMVKNYPELSDAQISKLIGTTKPTITAIRDRTHWNTPNITPQNPVGLGLCNGNDLEKIVAIARARAGTVHTPGAATAPDGVLGSQPAAAEPAEKEPVRELTAEDVFGKPSDSAEEESQDTDKEQTNA